MAKRKRPADTQPMRAVREQPTRKRGCLTYIAYAFIGIIALATIGQAGRGSQSSTSPRQVAPVSTSAVRASNTPVRQATSTRQATVAPVQPQSLLAKTAQPLTTVQQMPTKTASPLATVQPIIPPSSSSPATDVAFSSPRQWYTTGNANIRSCPSTTCSITRTLSAGDAVTLEASADGQAVNVGNSQWYRLQGGGYIYSGVVSSSVPVVQQAAPQTQPSQQTALPSVPQSPVQSPQYTCSGDIYDCGNFSNRTDLMAYFNACPGDPSRLDGNNDGVPCESLR